MASCALKNQGAMLVLMGTIVRKIIGAAIALLGLVLTGYSLYEVFQVPAMWLGWLGVAVVGFGIMLSGVILALEGFRSFLGRWPSTSLGYPEPIRNNKP
jgi:hypothetical protein